MGQRVFETMVSVKIKRRAIWADWISSAPVALLMLALTGCASVGPAVLPRDRFDYSSALSESWKSQTLLNIVKLRYMDSPIFVDVAQIVSGYQLTTSLRAGGTISANPSSLPTVGDFFNFGAQGTYTDRPTITYSPLTGDQYIRGIMTPIRPERIFTAILSSWPADAILFISTNSLNGLHNQQFGGMRQRDADPEFMRVLALIRKLQRSGALNFRILEGKDKTTKNVLFFRKAALSNEELADINEVKRLLRLNPEAREFQLVFGPAASSDREIAVQTRSLMEIMAEVAAQIDIPEADITEGRATQGFLEKIGDRQNIRFISIHSSAEKSPDAFLSIRYRDRWFWIDDRDLKTKRSFLFLMLLFSLADTGETKSMPVITIPAQ